MTSRLVSLSLFILFLICPLLFFTDLTRNPYYTQIVLLNSVTCFLWMLWLARGWRTGMVTWKTTPLDIPLVLLIAVCFISWGNSFFQHRFFILPIYSEGSRAMVFLIVNVYLVYAAALQFQDRERFRYLLWLVYIASTLASIYGIAQYFGVEWFWPHNLNPYGNRPVSTFGNPNFMSSYLAMVLPVAIADYIFKVTGVPRSALFVVVMSSAAALVATLTRSSWAGAVVGIVVLAAGVGLSRQLWEKIRRPVLILFIGMGIIVALWPKGTAGEYGATALSRLAEIKEVTKGPYGPVSQRLLIWTCAWEMVQDHPWLGTGWGCLELFYPYYQGPQLFKKVFAPLRTHANNAHDEILEYWSQIGTAGLGIVVLLWIVFFKRAASVAARVAEPWKPIEWGLIGGVAGMLVDNLLNVSVHFAVPGFIFWWWVGTALSLDPTAVQTRSLTLRPPVRAAALLAGLLLMGFMARSACLWAEEVNFFDGFKLSKSGADLVTAKRFLQRAYDWHHLEVNNNYELANVEARLGEKESALHMYQRALDANAGYDEIFFNRGTVLTQTGRIAEAIKSYQICIGINPLSHEVYNALAALYLKDVPRYGNAAEALYQQAVQVFPADKELWNNLGYLQSQRSNWAGAYDSYRKAVLVDPDFDLARRNLATAASKLPARPNDPLLHLDGLFAEAERLMADKQWDEARARLQQLIELVPNSFRAHFFLGNVLFSANHVADACREFEQSLHLNANVAAGWQNMAVCYDKAGQPHEAEAAYRRVLQLDPNNAVAKHRLGVR